MYSLSHSPYLETIQRKNQNYHAPRCDKSKLTTILKKFEGCNETLACATDETKLWSSLSAKQCQNPCSGPPPVYQDLITHHDWLVKKKSYCQFANQDEGKFETHFR